MTSDVFSIVLLIGAVGILVIWNLIDIRDRLSNICEAIYYVIDAEYDNDDDEIAAQEHNQTNAQTIPLEAPSN